MKKDLGGLSRRHRLYHRVPESLAGGTLYPLNRLAAVASEAAALERNTRPGST